MQANGLESGLGGVGGDVWSWMMKDADGLPEVVVAGWMMGIDSLSEVIVDRGMKVIDNLSEVIVPGWMMESESLSEFIEAEWIMKYNKLPESFVSDSVNMNKNIISQYNYEIMRSCKMFFC